MEDTNQFDSEERDILEESQHEDADSIALNDRLPASRWFILLLPLTAIAFAGTKEPWALALFAGLLSSCFTFLPPTRKVPTFITFSLVGFLFFSLACFLPQSQSSMPEWRKILTENYDIYLSEFRSPQPWISLESWILLFMGCLWLFYCLGRRFTAAERRFYLRSFCLGVSILTIIVLAVRRYDIHVPFWRDQWAGAWHIGTFPNRNHFSSLLAVASVMAFASAYDLYRNRKATWFINALAVLPLFAALLINTSRAGIILFFVGLGLWMTVATLRRNSIQRVAVSAALLLILATSFILFGTELIQKFIGKKGIYDSLQDDGRFLILQDTFRLISEQPFLGIGLGQFESIFTFYKTFIVYAQPRNLHPESDWAWILSEVGLIPMSFAAVVVFGIARKMGPWKIREKSGKRDRRIRNAAAIGVFLFAVHGLLDTPNHTLGIWVSGCLLAGISIRPRRSVERNEAPLSPLISRALGVFCLIACLLWSLIATHFWLLPSNSSARIHEAESNRFAIQQDYTRATMEITKAISLKPLQYEYYFLRAQWLLAMGRPAQEVLADFSRSRALESHNVKLCMSEAEIWFRYHPEYALPAVREAMRRDRAGAFSAYQYLLIKLVEFPNLRDSVRSLAIEPKLKLAYLQSALDANDFSEELRELLDMQPNLESFTPLERRTLFRSWYEKGDKVKLVSALEQNNDWKRDGWPTLANDRASKSDFKGAFQLAFDHLIPPLGGAVTRNSDISQLRRTFFLNPLDLGRGLDLYEAEKAKGLLDDALVTLEKLAQLPGSTPKVVYEQAIIQSKKGDYVKAWDRITTYISLIGPDKV